jgi:hypothetical protein
MGRNEYEKNREKGVIRNRQDKSRSKSRSRSASISIKYKRGKSTDTPKRDADSYDRKRNDRKERKDNYEKYYRRSRSSKIRFKRKTSRDNSAENIGKLLNIIKGHYQIFHYQLKLV